MAEKKKSAVSAVVTEEEGKKKVKAEEKGKENVQVGTAPKKRGHKRQMMPRQGAAS